MARFGFCGLKGNMLIRKLFVLQIVILLALLTVAAPVFAAEDTCAGDELARIFCATDLASAVNSAFQVSMLVGAVLAMLRIGYAGYLYMGSADMWSTKEHAKEVFKDAIIGLLLLLAIWMILNQINPDILKLELLQSNTST